MLVFTKSNTEIPQFLIIMIQMAGWDDEKDIHRERDKTSNMSVLKNMQSTYRN